MATSSEINSILCCATGLEMIATALRQSLEFGTQHEIKRSIRVVSKIKDACDRINADEWIYEENLPDDYPYDKYLPRSVVFDGVRMFPKHIKEIVS